MTTTTLINEIVELSQRGDFLNILKLTETHEDDTVVVKTGIWGITVCCADSKSIDRVNEIGKCGVLLFLQNMMVKLFAYEEIQIEICKAISELSRSHRNQEIMGNLQMPMDVLASMSQHPISSELQKLGLTSLSAMMKNHDRNWLQIVKTNCIYVVISIMDEYNMDLDIQHLGLLLMNEISLKCQVHAVELIGLNEFLLKLTQILRTYKDNKLLIALTLNTMANLLRRDITKECLIHCEGYIEIILEIGTIYGADSEVSVNIILIFLRIYDRGCLKKHLAIKLEDLLAEYFTIFCKDNDIIFQLCQLLLLYFNSCSKDSKRHVADRYTKIVYDAQKSSLEYENTQISCCLLFQQFLFVRGKKYSCSLNDEVRELVELSKQRHLNSSVMRRECDKLMVQLKV